jgi:hypothetical protein
VNGRVRIRSLSVPEWPDLPSKLVDKCLSGVNVKRHLVNGEALNEVKRERKNRIRNTEVRIKNKETGSKNKE